MNNFAVRDHGWPYGPDEVIPSAMRPPCAQLKGCKPQHGPHSMETNTQRKHTPGRVHVQAIGSNRYIEAQGPKFIADMDRNSCEDVAVCDANADRIVACWNACVDMADPEKEIAQLKSNLKRCEDAINIHIAADAQHRADKAKLVAGLKDIRAVAEAFSRNPTPVDPVHIQLPIALEITRALIAKHDHHKST